MSRSTTSERAAIGQLVSPARRAAKAEHGVKAVLRLLGERPRPDHPELPGYGYVITRKDLDALVADRASKAGAAVWSCGWVFIT